MNQLVMDQLPLCVDCDGTLLRTDLLHEAVFLLLKQSPLSLLKLPLWLLKGKAHMKLQLAGLVSIDARSLPYHEPLLDHLKREHESGRRLVLATASPRRFAETVADYLGLFDEVLASEPGCNLSGDNKAQRLVENYGEQGFVYAGNSRTDLKVWHHAAGALVVNATNGLLNETRNVCPVVGEFPVEPPRLGNYLRALRLHQWLKNILVFLPLLAAHQIMALPVVASGIKAFIAFGLCASSVYLLNDLLDLPADRAHPRKRRRPFASGVLPISRGAVLIPALLFLAFLISLTLPPLFLLVLGGYYVTTLAYSVWLKGRVIVDVMTLAILYTFRIIAGAAATDIVPSFWLLAFSMFLFLSLALVKRCSELRDMLRQNREEASGRGYQIDDLPLLMSLGTASAFMSILVMALYVNSPDVHKLYVFQMALWLVLPLLLFWISRVWMKTHRGEMHDDPVVFAIRDRLSLYVAILVLVVLAIASGEVPGRLLS
jgi:4-hydroxybenzoate polyprenyltransferase